MYTILAIDDAKDTLMLLDFDLCAEGYKVEKAQSGDSALQMLKHQEIDLILLDMYMPGLSGLATLEKLKADPSTSKIPVIMLSASNDEDEIVSALELGADDYVTKPYIAKVLLARIRTSQRLREKTLELERLAQTDFLTGINNRLNFESLATKAIHQCKRNEHSLAVAMFDIDFFKSVNDVHGHEAGDKVLIEFAKILSDCFRTYDVIGRIGGEESAVAMPNVTREESISACERLRKSVEQYTVNIDKINIAVTVSIGLTMNETHEESLLSLLKQADVALYQAKSNGRNQVVFYEQSKEGTMDNVLVDEQDNDPASYPGLDYSIGVANVLGDDDLYKEIIVMFYEDHCDDSKQIEQAISEMDSDRIKHLVHTLKGVSSSIGAMELFKHTQKLDEAVAEKSTDNYASLFLPVKQELDTVMEGIKTKLSL